MLNAATKGELGKVLFQDESGGVSSVPKKVAFGGFIQGLHCSLLGKRAEAMHLKQVAVSATKRFKGE
jgi:hypothetical protein